MPLTVDIVFADSARQPVRETSITELHWFYNKDRKDTAMVAVESNIESTGQTFEIAKIAFIRVSGIAYTVNAKTPVNPS